MRKALIIKFNREPKFIISDDLRKVDSGFFPINIQSGRIGKPTKHFVDRIESIPIIFPKDKNVIYKKKSER